MKKQFKAMVPTSQFAELVSLQMRLLGCLNNKPLFGEPAGTLLFSRIHWDRFGEKNLLALLDFSTPNIGAGPYETGVSWMDIYRADDLGLLERALTLVPIDEDAPLIVES